jgi:hypothetical protein
VVNTIRTHPCEGTVGFLFCAGLLLGVAGAGSCGAVKVAGALQHLSGTTMAEKAHQESLSANKCSATRIALAMIVSDGFTALADTKQDASTT